MDKSGDKFYSLEDVFVQISDIHIKRSTIDWLPAYNNLIVGIRVCYRKVRQIHLLDAILKIQNPSIMSFEVVYLSKLIFYLEYSQYGIVISINW